LKQTKATLVFERHQKVQLQYIVKESIIIINYHHPHTTYTTGVHAMYNTLRVYQMHTNASFIVVYITAGLCQEHMKILLVTFPVPFINFKCAFISRKHCFPII